MLEVTKTIEWDMGHRIPNHNGQCRYPHGHSYKLEVTLKGTPITTKGASDEGMLIDFSDLKKILKEKIQSVLDHRFIIAEEDHFFKKALGEEASRELKIVYMPFIPTSENLIIWCYEQIKNEFPENLSCSKLKLYESSSSWSEYTP